MPSNFGHVGDEARRYAWTDEHREIIDFYYWEPQHLGRVRNPLSSVRDSETAWHRVAGLEVATNQVLNMYLGMVPLERLDPEAKYFPRDTYTHVGGRQLEDLVRGIHGVTQPDGYFQGQAHDVALELKTKSRSSIEQVQKYLLFHHLLGGRPPLTLAYLTQPTDPAHLFGIAATTLDDVREAVALAPLPTKLSRLVDEAVWAQTASAWSLVSLTYDNLDTLVVAALDREANPVARNVHQGMLRWLRDRGLA